MVTAYIWRWQYNNSMSKIIIITVVTWSFCKIEVFPPSYPFSWCIYSILSKHSGWQFCYLYFNVKLYNFCKWPQKDFRTIHLLLKCTYCTMSSLASKPKLCFNLSTVQRIKESAMMRLVKLWHTTKSVRQLRALSIHLTHSAGFRGTCYIIKVSIDKSRTCTGQVKLVYSGLN